MSTFESSRPPDAVEAAVTSITDPPSPQNQSPRDTQPVLAPVRLDERIFALDTTRGCSASWC
jgi:hypothetical protein